MVSRKIYLETDTLTLDIQLDSLFSQRSLDAIASGMNTSVILELRLNADDRGRTLEQVLARRLEHDIWEGQYLVIEQSPMPDTSFTSSFREATKFCSEFNQIALGPLPEGLAFTLQARISVNPISIEQEQRTRRWLNFLQKGSLLELFISLDRPSERTRWLDIGRFRPEDLQ
ncbi:MAG: hypothetical protein O2954_07300 [bacterium]|nr:hypothetical protein [bacterium]